MLVPGSNLFGIALSVIARQPVKFYKDVGRTENAKGVYETTFAAPVTVTNSSVQAVSRDRYEQLGLDLQLNYVTWFCSQDVLDVTRGASGDQIEWGGRRYQLTSETDWIAMDGWTYVTAVDIGPANVG